MKKFNKNKRGFTLVEMVLVIAIIVLLAAVVGLSVSQYITMARSNSDRVGSQVSEFKANNAQINQSFVNLGY
ncbi:MAG: type II secretion system protein [Clostridiales bacterium]|nr:type II secretion system protein [Clostridiales bacterium]